MALEYPLSDNSVPRNLQGMAPHSLIKGTSNQTERGLSSKKLWVWLWLRVDWSQICRKLIMFKRAKWANILLSVK